MITPYYRSVDSAFTLLHGDCFELLPQFNFKFDMIFADPPYFLSNGGISLQAGQIVSVNKGDWDRGASPDWINDFNRRWIGLCREKLKDNGTLWISGTYHNIFSVASSLTELGFKILNVVTWVKTNPPPNISCRYFTYSTEFIIWARRSPKKPERRQANDRRVAVACHRTVGKVVRQAPDAETSCVAYAYHSCLHCRQRLGARPVCRQ